MTDTDRDPARLPEFGAGKPVQRDMGWKATSTPLGGVEAPHGPEIPSRSIDSEDNAARFARMAADPARYLAVETFDVAYRDYPSYVADAIGRVLEQLVEANDKNADLNCQLSEEREKVAALSQPRVFTLSGVVEADLAEQYESLRVEREELGRTVQIVEQRLDDAKRAQGELQLRNHRQAASIADYQSQISTLQGELADMTAERDAAAENARRERDRTELFAERISGAAWALTSDHNREAIVDTVWFSPIETLVDYLTGTLNEAGAKSRCRVVTSPRFYSDEQFDAAWSALRDNLDHEIPSEAAVEAVAEALGMRRAQS